MTYDPYDYWNERAREHGELYVAKGNQVEHWNREYQEFAPRLVSLVPFCVTLIDFGCGSGRFTGLLSTKCQHYIGVDIAPEGLEVAKKRHPGTEFWQVTGLMLPGTFDCIVGVFVLQHMVNDYEHWCVEFRNALREGGSFVAIDRDPWPDGSPLAHMLPRGPEAFAEASGLTLDRLERANEDHWAAKFVK